MSDRDRRAALDFARKSDADRWTQDDIDNLAAFRAAARAEGAAEAIEAAAQILDAEAHADDEAASHAREGTAPQNALRRSAADHRERAAKIRALAPAGLVAVAAGDARHAMGWCGLGCPHATEHDAAIDRIRAALARKGRWVMGTPRREICARGHLKERRPDGSGFCRECAKVTRLMRRIARGGKSNVTHGMSYTPTYQAWRHAKERCTNPKCRDWRNYGGRGITVCERWMSFDLFLADMGERPDGMSLGRIDNDGPYAPWNCRWETLAQQSNNRRTNHVLEWRGQRHTLTEWAKIIGVTRHTLAYRIKSGWKADDVFRGPNSVGGFSAGEGKRWKPIAE